MRTRRRLTWVIFGVCAVAVLEGLGWVTWQALRSERREAEARAMAEFQETLRLALWRMESEVTPIIAQEAARPYFHYRSFYPAERAYNRMWQEVEQGEVLVPSPLLEASGQFIRLHFEVGADGRATSPQAPSGNMRDLAEAQYVDGEFIELAGHWLDELSAMIAEDREGTVHRNERRLTGPAREEAAGAYQTLDQLEELLGLRRGAEVEPGSGRDAAQPGVTRAQQQVQQRSAAASEKEFEARQQAAQLAYSNVEPGRKKAAPEQEQRQAAEGPPPAAQESQTAASLPPSSPPPPARGGGAAALMTDQSKDLNAERTNKAEAVADARSKVEDLTILTDGAVVPERDVQTRPRVKGYQSTAALGEDVQMGPLEPVWLWHPDTGKEELIVRRTVRVHGAESTQGFWVDWPGLRVRLLASVADLLPGADLRPLFAGERAAPTALRLASLPVLLLPGSSPSAQIPFWSPMHVTLGFTWLAALGAIVAIGMVLRAAMELSDRRGRFVSAVTHELRTPLTTFCLYTEMLADGMVRDDGKRGEYLATLKGESRRLAGIVENVLEYARLGGGKRSRGRAAADAAELMARVAPALERAAGQCGMRLEYVDRGIGGVRVGADAPTVERILLNLVDNACKYASGAADKRLLLEAGLARQRGRTRLEILFRDHGPGIPRREQRRVFRVFQRGRGEEEAAKSGLGLGLALARGLARGLGGDLTVDGEWREGAGFRLWLPVAERAAQDGSGD